MEGIKGGNLLYTQRLKSQTLHSYPNRWHNQASLHTRTSWTEQTWLQVLAHFPHDEQTWIPRLLLPVYLFPNVALQKHTLPEPSISLFSLFSIYTIWFLKLRERKANVILGSIYFGGGSEGGITFWKEKERGVLSSQTSIWLNSLGILVVVTYFFLLLLPNRVWDVSEHPGSWQRVRIV